MDDLRAIARIYAIYDFQINGGIFVIQQLFDKGKGKLILNWSLSVWLDEPLLEANEYYYTVLLECF